MGLNLPQLLLSALLAVPSARASAHYTGYDHGPGAAASNVGLDIVLGVEDAEPGDHGGDYPQYLNSLSHRPRPMVPFHWYPYVPSGGRPGDQGGSGYYKPSRWPEGHGTEGATGAAGAAGQGRPSGAHKPTVLYLEGDKVTGVEGRPERPQLLPDPQNRPDQHNGPDRPHRPDRPDQPDRLDRPGYPERPYRPEQPDRPDYSERPEKPERRQRPLYPPVDAFICPDQHSCSDSVWDRRDTRRSLLWSDRGCFCDPECHQYGDCCRDAPEASEDEDGQEQDKEEGEDKEGAAQSEEGEKDMTQLKLRGKSEDVDTKTLKITTEGDPKFECRSVPAFSTLHLTSAVEENNQWYMMAACPPDFDGYDNKVRCEVPEPASEDPLSALPVTSVTTNITYSSLFCAMCHNDTSDLAFWQLGLRCPDINAHAPTEKQILDRLRRTANGWGVVLDSGRVYKCELLARPPVSVRPRPCRTVYDGCPRSSPLHDACRNHTAVVYAAGRAFRNVYCAMCAGGRPSQVRCSAPCAASARPTDFGGFRMRLGIAAGQDERCEESEIRDPFSRRCRSTVCSRFNFSLIDGKCVRAEQDEPGDGEDGGREDRGEEGEEAELIDPEDNLLPIQGLVDTENAIESQLIDALGPAAEAGAEAMGELEAPGAEEDELQQLNATENEPETEAEAVEAAAAAAAVAEEPEEEEEENQEDLEEGSGVAAEAVDEAGPEAAEADV